MIDNGFTREGNNEENNGIPEEIEKEKMAIEEEEGSDIEKPAKITFLKFFEDTAIAFQNPHFIDERVGIENQLNEWRSNLIHLPRLNMCVEKTKLSRALFFSSLCIKFLLQKFNENIDILLIHDTFTTISYRIHHLYDGIPGNENDLQEEFRPCKNNLLRCISIIQYIFPQFLNLWNDFSADDSVILLNFLFEFESNTNYLPNSAFLQKVASISESEIIKVLKNSSMSVEWLELFKYGLMKTSVIGHYADFHKVLMIVPSDINLYPKFIEILKESTRNEFSELKGSSKELLERIFDISILMIQTLLSPPVDQLSIQMASYLWKEIIDFDPKYLIECVYSFEKTFGKNVIVLLSETLSVIVNSDEDFFSLVESIGGTFKKLVNKLPGKFSSLVCNFLYFLMEMVNNDPDKYINASMSLPFYEVSKCIQKAEIFNFYCSEILQPKNNDGNMVLSPGSIFAFASSDDNIKNKYAFQVADNIIENSGILPSKIILYFISECCAFSGQRIHGLIDLTFSYINDEYATKSLIQISKNYPRLLIQSSENENLKRICEMATDNSESDINIIVNSILSLLFILDYLDSSSPFYLRVSESISKGILGKISNFYESEDIGRRSLELLKTFTEEVGQISSEFKNEEIMMSFLKGLFSVIIDTINLNNIFYGFEFKSDDDENEKPNLEIQEILCQFILSCLEYDFISNKDFLINWLGEALTRSPLPIHFAILSNLIDFFPTDPIMNFIMNAGSLKDNELMLEVIKFVKLISFKRYDIFCQLFREDYLFNPLRSADLKIVDTALDSILIVIENETNSFGQFFQNGHINVMQKVADGVFTNFQDYEIRVAIDIWIKLFSNYYVLPDDLINFVQSKIPSKSAELQLFSKAVYGEDDNDKDSEEEEEEEEEEEQSKEKVDEDENDFRIADESNDGEFKIDGEFSINDEFKKFGEMNDEFQVFNNFDDEMINENGEFSLIDKLNEDENKIEDDFEFEYNDGKMIIKMGEQQEINDEELAETSEMKKRRKMLKDEERIKRKKLVILKAVYDLKDSLRT